MIAVSYLVEGLSDQPVADALLAFAGAQPRRRIATGGKSRLDPRLIGLNRGARRTQPWFVLRDLDHDDAEACRGDLIASLLGTVHLSDGLVLRLAVRSIESWPLADHQGFSTFFGVSRAKVPRDPDALEDPKRTLVDLARSSSKREIREGVAPRQTSRSRVGPRYVELIGTYVETRWDIARARQGSPSLDRAVDRLKEGVAAWH